MAKRASDADQSGYKKHQIGESIYWIVTGTASVVATAATVLAACYAIKAYNGSLAAIGIAQDTLIAGSRPWIKINEVIVDSIEVADQGVTLSFGVKGANLGHSPAQRVTLQWQTILPKVDLPDSAFDPTSAIIKVCKQAMINHLNGGAGPEAVVFPGDVKRLGSGEFYEYDLIGADRVVAAREAFAQKTHLLETQTWPYRSSLTLVGCVTYSSPEASRPYQTSFGLDLWQRLAGGKPGSEIPFDLTTNHTITRDQIKASESRWANIIN